MAGPGDYLAEGNRLVDGALGGLYVTAALAHLPFSIGAIPGAVVEPYELPGSAAVTARVLNNEVQGHLRKPIGFGLRILAVGPSSSAVPQSTRVVVADNEFSRNTFGVIADAGFPQAGTLRQATSMWRLHGNYHFAKLSGEPAGRRSPRHTGALGTTVNPYLASSTYRLGLGGDVPWAEAWYSHPDGYGNTLVVDGADVPSASAWPTTRRRPAHEARKERMMQHSTPDPACGGRGGRGGLLRPHRSTPPDYCVRDCRWRCSERVGWHHPPAAPAGPGSVRRCRTGRRHRGLAAVVGRDHHHFEHATDSNGVASARWTLGDAPGPRTVVATVQGAEGSPVTFTATALALGDGHGGPLPLTISLGTVGAVLPSQSALERLCRRPGPEWGSAVTVDRRTMGARVAPFDRHRRRRHALRPGWVLAPWLVR